MPIQGKLEFTDESGDKMKGEYGKKTVIVESDPAKDIWFPIKSSTSSLADFPFTVKKLAFSPGTDLIDEQNTVIEMNKTMKLCTVKNLTGFWNEA